MDEDDFNADIEEAIAAGRRNLRAKTLLQNWCYHAEFARMAGIGEIERQTKLPIGSMGVQCKYSKQGTLFTWLLEDAAYDFYLKNCKGCSKRTPVGLPNILEFIGPRESEREHRERQKDAAATQRDREREARRRERADLRGQLSLEESFVLDLLDELDSEEVGRDDPRLEQLAKLAPEVFKPGVIDHLLPAAIRENFPYSVHAAKALLGAELEPTQKLAVAGRLIGSFEYHPAAIEYILSEAGRLDQSSFSTVLDRFVSRAVPLPPHLMLGSDFREYDSAPLTTLFEKRPTDVAREVDVLIADVRPFEISRALMIIIGVGDDGLYRKHARTIVAKLMRRRTLLSGESRDSDVLHYLREAASECFERFPEDVDAVIQSFLKDNDEVGRKEASKIYRSVMNTRFREEPKVGTAQRLAFRRLLWEAVDRADETMDDAGQFFGHSWDEYKDLAAEHLDDLIGAAANLSAKYDQVRDQPLLAAADSFFTRLDAENRRRSVDSLQRCLIDWAAMGARVKGLEGIRDFLTLYRELPDNQTRMRANIAAHFSKLLTGVDSLNLVLSDWYRALMDESSLVRASAASAWEDIPWSLEDHLPNLFFEAFVVLLNDPFYIVHQSAVRALDRNHFPRPNRQLLNEALAGLVIHYSKEAEERKDFLAECVAVYSVCLPEGSMQAGPGRALSGLLFELDGSALYHAIKRLAYRFLNAPGFVKVALKAMRSAYTRSISIDTAMTVVERTTSKELSLHADDVEATFEFVKPYKQQDLIEALLLISTLTKAGRFSSACKYGQAMLDAIPNEDRNRHWRLRVALVETASAIEAAIANGEDTAALIAQWSRLNTDLEMENEERAALRDVSPGLFQKN